MTNLPRRSFLRLGAGVLAAAELPRAAWAKRAPLAPLELKQVEIAVGASRPFGDIAEGLAKVGESLGLQAKCQKEEIFEKMHRI